MINVYLRRTHITPDGVFGWMRVGAERFVTVEDDWKHNEPGESCIPAGMYELHRTMYYKGGYETFEITKVPNRSRILIHKANTEEDVKGCIGIGMRKGKLLIKRDEDTGEQNRLKEAVVASGEAFRQFMKLAQHDDDGIIEIEWADGLP